MSKPLGTFAPDSPAWHDARRWRIGGSEIAQVCGQSPWGTADDLLAAKLAGPDATRRPSKAQERGTALEPAVLAWVCAREGLDLDPVASAATYVHPDLDWALYNPDGIDRGGALIEIKTTADRCAERGWGKARTDQIPAHYAAQVQWGMGVLGLDRCVLGVLHGATNGRPDLDLAVYRIGFDADLFRLLTGFGRRFIDRLNLARKDLAA